MTLTPQVDVGSDEAWVLLVPHQLQLVLPWDNEEDEALRALLAAESSSSLLAAAAPRAQDRDWAQAAAGFATLRTAAELQHRFLLLKLEPSRDTASGKPFDSPAWFPLPAAPLPAAAKAALVWELQVQVRGGDGNGLLLDDLALSFEAGTDVLAGDVLAILLPSILSAPTLLAEPLRDQSGGRWQVVTRGTSSLALSLLVHEASIY
jgi:hypothetical protein